ncbi:hypothetical protein LTR50_000688 [Elasticomyces elasticus]|nr:hypothetical protein LTR50_000688 [Elasticomyces elasticus]
METVAEYEPLIMYEMRWVPRLPRKNNSGLHVTRFLIFILMKHGFHREPDWFRIIERIVSECAVNGRQFRRASKLGWWGLLWSRFFNEFFSEKMADTIYEEILPLLQQETEEIHSKTCTELDEYGHCCYRSLVLQTQEVPFLKHPDVLPRVPRSDACHYEVKAFLLAAMTSGRYDHYPHKFASNEGRECEEEFIRTPEGIQAIQEILRQWHGDGKDFRGITTFEFDVLCGVYDPRNTWSRSELHNAAAHSALGRVLHDAVYDYDVVNKCHMMKDPEEAKQSIADIVQQHPLDLLRRLCPPWIVPSRFRSRGQTSVVTKEKYSSPDGYALI